MLIETSVFSTILVNSSKLILPSRSRSASIMVLSTIYVHIRLVRCAATSAPHCTYLLQLLVLQVASNHHLQYYEELAVADVAVAVNVVYAECKAQLLFLVSLAAEGGQTRHELLEVHVAAAILVENGNHACRERVRGNLGEGKEFVAVDSAGVVLVELHETLAQAVYLLAVNCIDVLVDASVFSPARAHELRGEGVQLDPEAILSSIADDWFPILAACK